MDSLATAPGTPEGPGYPVWKCRPGKPAIPCNESAGEPRAWFAHRGLFTLRRGALLWLLRGFLSLEARRRRRGNRRGRRSVALLGVQKAFGCELRRRRVEGGKLSKPLAVHQTLVRETCVRGRKGPPASPPCRRRGSRRPPLCSACSPPPTPSGPSSKTSCERGCCCASSCPSRSSLFTHLSRASKHGC